jgi:ribulose-5-phosphate 4-epimerase/fuculose-1-phosphate aldolase
MQPEKADDPNSGDVEWRLRAELAACFRLVALFGWEQTINNQISVRLPEDPNVFLVNPIGTLFEEITASGLIKVRADGSPLSGQGYNVNAVGFYLHSVVHEGRSDVDCAIHFHSVETVAVANHPQGLLPLCREAMLLSTTTRYHDFEGLLSNPGVKERLIRDLGDGNLFILRNHGIMALGATIPAAFNLALNLDKASRIQIATLAQGGTPVSPSLEEIRAIQDVAPRPTLGLDLVRLEFEALMRKLDRLDPSYRQ